MSTNEPSSTKNMMAKDAAAPKQQQDATTTTQEEKPNNNNNNNNNNNQKKRKQHWFQRKEQKKKERVEKQAQHTQNRRGLDENWESQTPHQGSFANPAARTLFNVQVPQIDDEHDSTSIKVPKRKVAILLAYTGTNYGGFQMNIGQRSLHAVVELALYKARLLSKRNFGFPHKYSWSSSARTDKGVHACAQVISVKLQALGAMTMDATRELVNQHLPSDVRVLDIVQMSRAFCAKTQRDRARYTYMIPSFVLYDRPKLQKLFQSILGPDDVRHGRSARDPLSQEEITKLAAVLTQYRVTSQKVQDLKNALHQYEGTRSFHNFTNGKTADDANATRYIVSFQTQDPIMMEGIEWIPTQVVGQSFLLHQIRKMVSLAVDVARGSASVATMQRALSTTEEKCQLNMAPAQGLFLDMSIFEGYNKRKTNAHLQDLDWVTDSVQTTPAVQRWKDFRENVVMKHIGKEEATQGNFIKYLYVQEYVYDHKTQYNVDNNKKK